MMTSGTPSILRQLEIPGCYPAVLATLFSVQGSSYRRAGARMLLDRMSRRHGSISGGCLEDDLVERMRSAPGSPASVAVYDTTAENDLVWGVGLGCHGVVRILIEPLSAPPPWLAKAQQQLRQRETVELWIESTGTRLAEPRPHPPPEIWLVDRIEPPIRLVVYGAGEDARPLVRLGKTLGWTVQVRDPRPSLATATRFPEADDVVSAPVAAIAADLKPDPWTAAVIMTHSYRFDQPLLAALLPLGLRYVGLLGPQRRAERLLADSGLSREAPRSLYAPVGLDLGGDGPEAVALAIAAEIQTVFAQRAGCSLRERTTPIHADATGSRSNLTAQPSRGAGLSLPPERGDTRSSLPPMLP